MIKLTKLDEPEILRQNSNEWTRLFLEKIARGEKPTLTEATRYRHPEVKKVIVAETHGKCAYCESKLRHIHHGDVEHIYPKSLDEAKRFLWKNLTLACEVCNQNKSNKDPNIMHIIDPYEVNPESHIVFTGAIVFPKGTAEGQSTITLLDLNRVELVERRQEKLCQIMALYNTVFQHDLPEVTKRVILDNIIKHEGADSAPYTAMVRSIVKNMSNELPQELGIT